MANPCTHTRGDDRHSLIDTQVRTTRKPQRGTNRRSPHGCKGTVTASGWILFLLRWCTSRLSKEWCEGVSEGDAGKKSLWGCLWTSRRFSDVQSARKVRHSTHFKTSSAAACVLVACWLPIVFPEARMWWACTQPPTPTLECNDSLLWQTAPSKAWNSSTAPPNSTTFTNTFLLL